jgi:hypothetical protein
MTLTLSLNNEHWTSGQWTIVHFLYKGLLRPALAAWVSENEQREEVYMFGGQWTSVQYMSSADKSCPLTVLCSQKLSTDCTVFRMLSTDCPVLPNVVH